VAASRERDRASFDGMGLLDGLSFYTTGGSRADGLWEGLLCGVILTAPG